MALNTQSLDRILSAETTVSSTITVNTAFTLPSAANTAGKLYTIYNPSASTANVLVNAADASLVVTVQPGTAAVVTPIVDAPTTNTSWMVVSVGLNPATASLPGIVTTGTQTIAGTKTFSGGVKFTNGTSAINAYDNQPSSVAISGATTSPTITTRYTVVGEIVLVRIESFSTVTKNGAGTFTLNNVLPALVRPGNPTIFPGYFTVNGTRGFYYLAVGTDGTITFAKDAAGNNFANADTMQVFSDISISYTVST